MKPENRNRLIFSITFTIYLLVASALAQTPNFTYQGKLNDAGAAATGTYQMEFRLYDAPSGGALIGGPVTADAVSVTEGVFTVGLNFGAAAFPGADRFLQISVRRSAGEGFVTLNPRQQIASSPYSIRTLSAAQADTAVNSNQLGGVPASQYLQTNGSGSGLTNLSAASIATGTLSNARLGQIPTANIADNAVTAPKIGAGQVVKGITFAGTTLTDNITLAQGNNITITPTANTLTIASTSGGVGGEGTMNRIPVWTGPGTLANSTAITQSDNGVQLPNGVQLAVGAQGNRMSFGSPNGETGITIAGAQTRADVRFDGGTLRLLVAVGGGPPPITNGLGIDLFGNVNIGRNLRFDNIPTGGISTLCLNGSTVSLCGSSLRYKTDLQAFDGGLSIINRLRPVTFKWKSDKTLDVGFGAEHVAEIEPLLVTHNDNGEIEGVKYDRLSVVFVNAFKEQQKQIGLQQNAIEQQRKQIDNLIKIVCRLESKAGTCPQ